MANPSRRSSSVRRSRGGNASQSSWYELLPENDGFLDRLGLLGIEGPRVGVSRACSRGVVSKGGVPLGSGVRTASLSVDAVSDLWLGIGMGRLLAEVLSGSAISTLARRWDLNAVGRTDEVLRVSEKDYCQLACNASTRHDDSLARRQ